MSLVGSVQQALVGGLPAVPAPFPVLDAQFATLSAIPRSPFTYLLLFQGFVSAPLGLSGRERRQTTAEAGCRRLR
ncbi:hypothetical protein [Streptomyces telluris]|uniref:Uncharacterized protein n=1 Tax=Streptomyces telluris TaxID=2720021 RepID=A0A9X2LQ89_9ACTN|nr:hypothetical protein [Streptomyces telluris]MCQ8775132.1 hypothetical protein [Streptomyces telluris]NJP82015.1 hypothetical protein [Streptomyces telluris]